MKFPATVLIYISGTGDDEFMCAANNEKDLEPDVEVVGTYQLVDISTVEKTITLVPKK